MAKRIGTNTIRLERPLSIIGYAAAVSRKEAQGPLNPYFDCVNDDSTFGEKTWEKAESALQKCAVNKAIKKAGVRKIRIHDLRHSHVSLLIDMGFSAVAIAERVGHESIEITYRYAHMFPSKQTEMAERLNIEGMAM